MTLTENMQGSEFKRKLMFTQIKEADEVYKTDRLVASVFATGLLIGWVLGIVTLALVI